MNTELFGAKPKRVQQIGKYKVENLAGEGSEIVFNTIDVSEYAYIFIGCLATAGHTDWRFEIRQFATDPVDGEQSSAFTDYNSRPPILESEGLRRRVGEYTETGSERLSIQMVNNSENEIPQADVYLFGVK